MGDQSGIPELVSALNRLSLAIEGQSQRADSSQGWEVVSEEPESGAPSVPVSEPLSLGRVAFGDYNRFAELLPECPEHLVPSCRRLRGGQYSSEYRAKRAWECGFWAGLAFRNRISKPRAALPIDVRPQVYIVLKGKNISSPARVSSASDLYRLTGRLDESTLCQGFPSIAEAEIFCVAARVSFPEQYKWQ